MEFLSRQPYGHRTKPTLAPTSIPIPGRHPLLFERIESEGLAHYSYLVGDQREAVVIDPRRDCGIYIDMAARAGYRIVAILETHRNEDYAIGSVELAARLSGHQTVDIWHADAALDYQYGAPAQDGQTWQVGRLKLTALHTPGHTPGHMSYLLTDPDKNPWVVFTGDALFAGDVGRVDLLGEERMPEMAEMLHDTLFNRLLPLGDHVIIGPAHGSGSVCGSEIAERVWSTIGLERRHNRKLQYTSKEAFLANVPRILERPPYFRRIERLNLEGAPVLGSLPVPPPIEPRRFAGQALEGIVLDTRMELAFTSAHVPQRTVDLAGRTGELCRMVPALRQTPAVGDTAGGPPWGCAHPHTVGV